MRFDFTPEEARTTAEAVHRWLKKGKYKVVLGTRVHPDAPYRTTLVGTRAGACVLVEAQGSCTYDNSLQAFSRWLGARRIYAEFYLATSDDTVLPARVLRCISEDGVGLLLVDEHKGVRVVQRPRNFALVVAPDPTLALGKHKKPIGDLVEKFNAGDRKDALRDMCELVEGETERLIERAVAKGWITPNAGQVARMDWAGQINALASANQSAPGKSVIVSPTEKDDLHSFRNARNLLDHKVKNKREEKKREQQFAERMMQGPRLTALLLAKKRRVC